MPPPLSRPRLVAAAASASASAPSLCIRSSLPSHFHFQYQPPGPRHASSRSNPLPHKPSPHRPRRPGPLPSSSSPPPHTQTPAAAATTARTARPLRPYYIVASVFLFTTSAYIGNLSYHLYSAPAAPADPALQDNSLTHRYDDTARDYDALVERTEFWSGITRLRKRLVGQARGRVLEACVGTGRNLEFYDFDFDFGGDRGGDPGGVVGMVARGWRLLRGMVGYEEEEDEGRMKERVTGLVCVDRSAAMIEIAREKWARMMMMMMHPHTQSPLPPPAPAPTTAAAAAAASTIPADKVLFLTQPASDPLPASVLAPPHNKFDTTISTFSLCSLPKPAHHLLTLASLTDPHCGQILLLEHGRGRYAWLNWILDHSAQRHAERHGCWYNRDIRAVLRECEAAGVIVVEEVERGGGLGGGTVWLVRCRVGETLGGVGRKGGERSLLDGFE